MRQCSRRPSKSCCPVDIRWPMYAPPPSAATTAQASRQPVHTSPRMRQPTLRRSAPTRGDHCVEIHPIASTASTAATGPSPRPPPQCAATRPAPASVAIHTTASAKACAGCVSPPRHIQPSPRPSSTTAPSMR